MTEEIAIGLFGGLNEQALWDELDRRVAGQMARCADPNTPQEELDRLQELLQATA